jgi:hypothetical protein
MASDHHTGDTSRKTEELAKLSTERELLASQIKESSADLKIVLEKLRDAPTDADMQKRASDLRVRLANLKEAVAINEQERSLLCYVEPQPAAVTVPSGPIRKKLLENSRNSRSSRTLPKAKFTRFSPHFRRPQWPQTVLKNASPRGRSRILAVLF